MKPPMSVSPVTLQCGASSSGIRAYSGSSTKEPDHEFLTSHCMATYLHCHHGMGADAVFAGG